MMKSRFYNYFLFVLISAGLIIFYFSVCYFQMPKGDDLLSPFYMGFLHYVDGSNWIPDERVETLHQAIIQYISYYMQFNGRLPMLFQGYLFNKLGWLGMSIVSAVVYVSIIILITRIGLRSWKQVEKAPMWLLITSLYMYELTATGSYIEMWTFVCQYGIPTLLYLLYYMLIEEFYKSKENTKWKTVGLITLGVVAGSCHECLGVFCISLVAIRTICELIDHHISIKKVWVNLGLVFGYIVTFCAPGNFKRLLSEHDIERFSLGIVEKIWTSIEAHILAVGSLQVKVLLLIGIFGVAIVFSCLKTKWTMISFLKSNVEILFTLILSVLVWAIFAPPVPQYGLQFWKALLIIILLRGIEVDIFNKKWWNLLSVIVLVIWVSNNVNWVSDLSRVTIERRTQIAEAIKNGQEVVYVKKYPESTSRYITHFNMTNENVFEHDFAIEYYGIKVLIEAEH